MEAELFHADGRTDMTKLTVTFCNFANAPKNLTIIVLSTPDTYSRQSQEAMILTPLPLRFSPILLKFNTMLNERRLKSNICSSNWRKDSEDWAKTILLVVLCIPTKPPCRPQLERSQMATLSSTGWMPACIYPVTQDPRGSFEIGTVLRRRDNFNKCFCFDISKFQIAGLNIVTCIYTGFVCVCVLILLYIL